jgi:NhaP-type Na+/H+ or K+/H+ antiporter
MHTIDTTIACLAGLTLVMTLFTYGIRRHWLNEPLLALAVGVLIGPEGLGWLDLRTFGEEPLILEVVARYTLAVALIAVGLELRGYLGQSWQPLSVLVVGGAAVMWAMSSLLTALVLDLTVRDAILLGAVLAPIDPILTATVTTGRVARESVPERIRHLLSAESAARHGIGLVLVLLPVFLITDTDHEAWGQWLADGVVRKGLLAVLIGAAAGFTAGRLHRWSVDRDAAESPTGPLTALFLAFALLLGSGAELVKSDGALAVLVAGLVFVRMRVTSVEDANEFAEQHRHYTSLLKQLLQVPVFALLGVALPWAKWVDLGWRAPAVVVVILLLRRIPVLLLLKPLIRDLRRWDEALFVGWFGPVGVGALYFATVAHRKTHVEQVWVVTTLLVAATVVAHDLTATPLSRWLSRRGARNPEATGPERTLAA